MKSHCGPVFASVQTNHRWFVFQHKIRQSLKLVIKLPKILIKQLCFQSSEFPHMQFLDSSFGFMAIYLLGTCSRTQSLQQSLPSQELPTRTKDPASPCSLALISSTISGLVSQCWKVGQAIRNWGQKMLAILLSFTNPFVLGMRFIFPFESRRTN